MKTRTRLKATLLAAVALVLIPYHPATAEDDKIEVFGRVIATADGTFEVQGGSIIMVQGGNRTEVEAERIIIKDGGQTIYTIGDGTLRQTPAQPEPNRNPAL